MHRQGLRAAALLRLTPDWTLKTGFLAQTIDVDDSQYANLGADQSYARRRSLMEPSRKDFDGVWASVDGDFGWARLRASSSVQSHGLDARYDATPAAGLFGLTGKAALDQADDLSAAVHEVRLNGRNRGVESEVEWREGPWTLDAHAVVNDPELTRPDPGFALGTDTRLPAVADFSVQGGVVHEAHLAHATVRSELRLGYVGPTDIALSPTSTGASAGYLTSSLGVGVEIDRWAIRASLDNLFNRSDDTFTFGNPFYGSGDISTPQRPLTARLALTARF